MAAYYSQYGQDKILDEVVFKKKTNGVFVDVGASDGIEINNTYFFEKERNWTGICIEPRISAFQKLVKNRTCICQQVCINDKYQDEIFCEIKGYSELLSGLSSSFTKEHVKRIQREHDRYSQIILEYKVHCIPLTKLLVEQQIAQIDLCSIDVECGEMGVLHSIDFEKIDIDVFVIEWRNNEGEIRSFMTKRNYISIAKCNSDIIYVKKDFPI